MKKTKKLTLSKESLRKLNDEELEDIAGGAELLTAWCTYPGICAKTKGCTSYWIGCC